MTQHELILLSPYRLPGKSSLQLSNEDMTAWLNAYTALWHPALLWNAKGPPRVDAQYDHEQPRGGVVYVLPESPPLYLAEDWEQRVRSAGSVVFHAGSDRSAALEIVRAESDVWLSEIAPDSEKAAPFFGLGLGYLLETTLAEAMEHENLLDAAGFWEDVQKAIQECYFSPEDGWHAHLEKAAQKLLAGREALYPVTIHLLDLLVLDDKTLDQPWPASLSSGMPLNLVACGSLLEKLAQEQPAKFEILRTKVKADEAEICGGCYLEREDPLLPLDSQLWNLQKGLAVTQNLLQTEVRVFARKRFGFHPQLPLQLSTNGITRALYLSFNDGGGLPQYSSCVVGWASPDGKQIDAFVRVPYATDDPATFFNLAHYWHKTTREDHAATIALVHSSLPAAPWYRDLMELARLGPLFGTWTTYSRYFSDVLAGEHPAAASADDFHADFLSERVNAHVRQPVSAFADHLRQRRRLDACYTFSALLHSLSSTKDRPLILEELKHLEDVLEQDPGVALPGLTDMEKKTALALADRLQARAVDNEPGTMLLNPCAFARRVAVEIDGASRPLAVGGHVKACQLDGALLRAVVEVPALGFAWIPKEGPPGTQPMSPRLQMADPRGKTIRNEFFEAEVDPVTGGLKAIRDHKTRVNRLGQRLVFNPNSRMIARDINVTLSGPALGEIVSEGEILGEQNQVLATFKQRLRVWLGRPLLEMRIELHPAQPAAGYPWHAYFGSRFAWRDERSMLMRGCGGSSYLTTHTRPQTPDFLELRQGQQGTVLLTGGLPFHQRHEGRMLDVILQPEGEEASIFDLGIALDRDMPMQTALGYTSPVAIVPTKKGPPHVGNSGWLFHLDAPNLLLTRLVPGPLEKGAESPSQDALTARLYECAGQSGIAEFRCVRNPKRAVILDARGQFLLQASPSGDAVPLEVTPNDLVHLQVEFS